MNPHLWAALLIVSLLLVTVAAIGFWQTDRARKQGMSPDVAMGPGAFGMACLTLLIALWVIVGLGAAVQWLVLNGT